ncbi:MAG: ComEC family competence protein [Microscillaceae bacterium]|jgi:competence protein ComEC|nr:ComEC family competence protein [Microscillaceae bacterium]
MFHWTPYVFVRFTLWFLLGIVVGTITKGKNSEIWGGVWLVLAFVYLGLRFGLPKSARRQVNVGLGLIGGVMLMALGVLRTYQYQAENSPNHILNQPKILAYRAVLQTNLEAKAQTYKTEAHINLIKTAVGWQTATGKILVYLRRDSAQKSPNWQYGTEILVMGSPQLVTPPKNPQEFDYQQFLKYQNIYHQHFIQKSQYQTIRQTTPNYLIYWTLQLREASRQALQKLVDSPQEAAIAVALILGVKEQMDDEIRTAYANTGLMHVLAVSGMHVAFLMLILEFLLLRLQKLPQGKYIYAFAIIGLLWMYAFVTGLSASVLRAVVMFSFVAWGDALGRKRLIYNNIAVSAFVLLLYNPCFLWSVGFQLSYLAVLGIVYIQPKIYRLWEVNNYYLDKTWELISVSLAAQLLTFPLGLYYFQQFPNYFLLANLLIVPLSGWVMWAGVVTLALAWLPGLNYVAGQILRWLIYAMNQITFALEDLPYALSEGVYINLLETFLLYLLILLPILLGVYKRLGYWGAMLLVLVAWVGIRVERNYQQKLQTKMVIYHLNKHSVWGFMQGKKALLLADSAFVAQPKGFDFSLRPSLATWGIGQIHWQTWQDTRHADSTLAIRHFENYSLLVWQKKTFLIIRQKLKYSSLQALAKTKIDYTVIQNNAVADLERLHKALTIRYLILDSSNSNTRSQKLLQTAKILQIKTHSILRKGAWVWNLNPKKT